MQEAGLNGYEYEVKNIVTNETTKTTTVADTGIPIKITTDGEYLVTIRVKDVAGNTSETKSVEVHKDTKQPEIQGIEIPDDSITAQGFTVNVTAGDETSGIAKYEYYVNDQVKATTTEGTCSITGLTKNTNYKVYVKVYDVAGNQPRQSAITYKQTKELKAPTISATGTGLVNGYYKGTVTVKVKDNGGTSSGATKIKILNDGKDYKEINRTGEETTFTIETDGNYKLTAYMLDSANNKSEVSNTETFTRDNTPPKTASLSGGTVDTTAINNVTVAGEDTLSRSI